MKQVIRCGDCRNYVGSYYGGKYCQVLGWYSEPDDGCTFEAEDVDKENKRMTPKIQCKDCKYWAPDGDTLTVSGAGKVAKCSKNTGWYTIEDDCCFLGEKKARVKE